MGPRPFAGNDQKHHLSQTGQSDTDGQQEPDIAFCLSDTEQQEGNQNNIEKDRSGGHGGEFIESIQHAAQKGDNCHGQQIGEGNAGEIDGEFEPQSFRSEAGRKKLHHERHENHE